MPGLQNSMRNGVIDLLRGFSILSVILLHCKIHLPMSADLLSYKSIRYLIGSGYYGVMIFFVISGFLITNKCLEKWSSLQSIEPKQFYLMRSARILPCLFALLILLSCLHACNINGYTIQNTSLKQALFSALTFQINRLESNVGYLPASWDVLWSLSIEEIFYLGFPILCLVIRSERYLIITLLLFVILGPFSRSIFTNDEYWQDYAYLSCIDGIAIGCLAALYSSKLKPKGILTTTIFLLGCLFFAFVLFARNEAYKLGLTRLGLHVTILKIGVALILIGTKDAYFNSFKTIRWFGRNSYEIYLTHSFFVLFASRYFYHTGETTGILCLQYFCVIMGSGLFGELISTYFSKPMNAYLRMRNKGVSYSPQLN